MSVISHSQDRLDISKLTLRPPTVGGSFYPSDSNEIKSAINQYLDTTLPLRFSKEIIGLVVPHAGYVYSGWVAGKAYRELQGRKYDAVVIIGPSHHKYFEGSSVFNGDAYMTPLGNAIVDQELAIAIAKSNPNVNLSLNGHSWADGFGEHSIEVQVPFLQTVLPGTPIVPICMGTQDFESIDELSKAIVKGVMQLNRNVLLVASSDLSHFHNYQSARNLDRPFVETFSRYDYFKLSLKASSHDFEACGWGPIIVVMLSSEQLGGTLCKSLLYATSADSPNIHSSKDRVVGYCAGVILRNEDIPFYDLPELNDEVKDEILLTARTTIENYSKGMPPEEKRFYPRILSKEYAAFVTLRKQGKLRGCMGHSFASKPLILEISEAAIMAASKDMRFCPVSSTELPELKIEVSILSPMKKVWDTTCINPEIDGVMIRLGGKTGLFLPQVAADNKWDRVTLLENLGNKAGLDRNAYKHPAAELYTFRTIRIKE